MNAYRRPFGALPRLAAVFACCASISVAQSANSTPSDPASAAWTNVQALGRTAGNPQAFRDAATAAKTFYTTYPNDAHAAEARKQEALFSLQGVTDGDHQYEHNAQQIARTYRGNLTNPLSSRFQVALLAERTDARGKLGGKATGHDAHELESIADSLHREFGDVPQVFNFYVSVARSADMTTARQIAQDLERWPANEEAAAEARSILARDALRRQKLDWQLQSLYGPPLDLAHRSSKYTVIYAWSPANPGALALLRKYEAALPADTAIIYLAVGGTVAEVQAAVAASPVNGTICHEPDGVSGPTVEKLQVRTLPFVYVLNRSSALAGFGPVSELPNLIRAAR